MVIGLENLANQKYQPQSIDHLHNQWKTGKSVWQTGSEIFDLILLMVQKFNNTTFWRKKWPYRRQAFSVVLLLSSLGWIQIHSSNDRNGTSLSALCFSAHMTILWSLALCVAAIAIVVLLGSVVHSLGLPVLLWDAVFWAGQLAIVRHWPGSGATCPFPGHDRSGSVTGKGWRDWCCWSYQGGFWGTGVCDRWSSSGWDLITFEKRFCDIWWSLKSQKSNVIS